MKRNRGLFIFAVRSILDGSAEKTAILPQHLPEGRDRQLSYLSQADLIVLWAYTQFHLTHLDMAAQVRL